jgi:hypothetical protein
MCWQDMPLLLLLLLLESIVGLTFSKNVCVPYIHLVEVFDCNGSTLE